MALVLSKAEQKFVNDGILQNVRIDGRQRDDFRAISLEQGVIPQASGSARLRLGGTDVLVGVKVEIGTPLPEHPSCGRAQFSVDVAANASLQYEGRGGEDLAAALTQALEKCFGGSSSGAGAALDPKSLGIIDGRTCWVVNVDGLVLAADGNLLDALAAATKAALADTRVPKVTVVGGTSAEDVADFEVNEDPSTCLPLDMQAVPVVVTLRQCNRHYYLDVNAQEEALDHPGLSVSLNASGTIVGLLKCGGAGLDPSVMREMMEVAQKIGRELHKAVDSYQPAQEEEEEMGE
uniref:Ribosomal RNA-processing protein 42 n=1 Tax=Pyramimonas obovata TaxID=1411642 RepID=A0A7S0R1V8_9CHLO|mmetsp:Transcript_23766/g.51917  ORF Transcript_23766/g.51917 Transcript_23766/m.51917 type:complete len:292 (+) Transcript_23766:119-994(+)|eukprot:CAMPEP_0118921998 /NCGR_PEP_ID=MMETSP1169-20130426/1089_1 /TAXON_ID=36882 /ORGANISM="Pyramimonas obovata, Strain CCMP722" /LENGTH=291 /DNA_ID=CAMNT_0006862811 /DNA_START=116 /DNA_END=991 /DNA_ORIENTATION=-